jgi:hypothetical protein
MYVCKISLGVCCSFTLLYVSALHLPLNVKIGQELRKKVSKQSKHTVWYHQLMMLSSEMEGTFLPLIISFLPASGFFDKHTGASPVWTAQSRVDL